MSEICDGCMGEASALYDTDAGQAVCVACLVLTLRVERDAARRKMREATDSAEKAERDLREFQAGLTDALRAHNVPATPTWADAIHWLARHGGS